MKRIILVVLSSCAALTVMAGPFGSGGVDHVRLIRVLDPAIGSKFFNVKCKIGNDVEVLNEQKQWFSVPPGEPLQFYSGPSPQAFAEAACKTSTSSKNQVVSVTAGVGATASGRRSFDVTCANGKTIVVLKDPQGNWGDLLGDFPSLDKLKGKDVKVVASAVCSQP